MSSLCPNAMPHGRHEWLDGVQWMDCPGSIPPPEQPEHEGNPSYHAGEGPPRVSYDYSEQPDLQQPQAVE